MLLKLRAPLPANRSIEEHLRFVRGDYAVLEQGLAFADHSARAGIALPTPKLSDGAAAAAAAWNLL